MNSIIIFCAKYLFIFVVLVVGVVWLKADRNTKLRLAASVILAGIIAFILSRIASRLYFDPRPFVTEHVKPLIPHGADNGFPSDHALLTMTLTAIMFFYNKKAAYIALALTVVVGLARILAKLHSPLDIGGAWLIGIIGATASYFLIQWFWQKKLNTKNKHSA